MTCLVREVLLRGDLILKKSCCCTYSSIENSTRDSWQTIVAGYILSQIPSKKMHLCTVMEKNNTSGRKSAGNFKQRNDFSCFAACTVCGAYIHTHTHTYHHLSTNKSKAWNSSNEQTAQHIPHIGLPLRLQKDSNPANLEVNNNPPQQGGRLCLLTTLFINHFREWAQFIYYPLYESLLHITLPNNNHSSWQNRFLPGADGSSFFPQLPWLWDQRIHVIKGSLAEKLPIYERHPSKVK